MTLVLQGPLWVKSRFEIRDIIGLTYQLAKSLRGVFFFSFTAQQDLQIYMIKLDSQKESIRFLNSDQIIIGRTLSRMVCFTIKSCLICSLHSTISLFKAVHEQDISL